MTHLTLKEYVNLLKTLMKMFGSMNTFDNFFLSLTYLLFNYKEFELLKHDQRWRQQRTGFIYALLMIFHKNDLQWTIWFTIWNIQQGWFTTAKYQLQDQALNTCYQLLEEFTDSSLIDISITERHLLNSKMWCICEHVLLILQLSSKWCHKNYS